MYLKSICQHLYPRRQRRKFQLLRAILILALVLIFFQLNDQITDRNSEANNGSSASSSLKSLKNLDFGNFTTRDKNGNLTIFYNVFIPNGDKKVQHALSIVKEQLGYRRESIYPNTTLYYISIGQEMLLDLNCTDCMQLEHQKVGNEILTLRQLYDYCSIHTRDDVIYIHNKGSFHPSHQNDILRRMLTKSVFSKECLLDRFHIPDSSCKCNVCSARFSPIPHFHTPGNMWVASCSYISKLLPPDRFGLHMDDALKTAPQSQFGNAKKIGNAHIGRGRYSAEHWVHSHPDVCPCDLYPGPYLWNYEKVPITDDWEPNLQKAPRFPFLDDYVMERYFKYKRKRVAKWFSLDGRIHEWTSLYNTLPLNDSWVWNYYAKSKNFTTLF